MSQADIGVYGLGTMGSALALNLAEHGFRVAVSNRGEDWADAFRAKAGVIADRIDTHTGISEFAKALKSPRIILLMIPSGAPVDTMIETLGPHLGPGDIVIDGGNSDFNDTVRRAAALAKRGLEFVGMGVSGGAEGARHGPSLMIGGSAQAWEHLRPMLEAVAARYAGDPCVARLGPDGAGHFVKIVHNGIEYADMQMIAEIYGILRDVAGWDARRAGELFARWNEGPLESYLTEITGTILQAKDPGSGRPVVDLIEDRAGQKGTGRWTVIEALKLGEAPSAIEAAVGARVWSSEKAARRAAEALLDDTSLPSDVPSPSDLANAMLAGRLIALAQGFRVLSAASDEFGWQLDLARVAEIWRAGCIIRSVLLDDVADALRGPPPQGRLILAPTFREILGEALSGLRRTVAAAALSGQPVPALAAALEWYDSMSLARGTANLIQAQRDFFGAHGFELVGVDGEHHGPWGRSI